VVRLMKDRGMSERHALRVWGMSASALRYRPAEDRNRVLRQEIAALAYRHRRYGAGMIYLKLRQKGLRVNHKRVDRLYALDKLQLRRRKRKKVPVGERQPLLRPQVPDQVWSMDFVFDRVAGGRALKCLAVVDDATAEAIVLEPRHSMSGRQVVELLDRVRIERGLPRVIRSDNGKEFTSKAMLSWAIERGVDLRLIEPGKPNQNAYVESFNGRFRDACLNENWFATLGHARVVIETWKREYNEERPKRGLDGLTPVQYARRLAARADTVMTGL
jgi:transposase InsO family protein